MDEYVGLGHIFKFRKYFVRSLFATAILSLLAGSLVLVHASQNNADSIFQSLQYNNLVDPSNTSFTSGWKTASDVRSNLGFSLKFPSTWSDGFDHCVKPQSSIYFDLPAGCIKTVIFTDNLPDRDVSTLSGDRAVISTTQTKVNEFRAIRKIYTLIGDDTKTPVTYELWIYDKDYHPFVLVLSSIGVNTDKETAESFIETLDKMVNTLQLQRK
ncbi:MAG TPA: hypothetical protein VKC53_00230 [Patescibacteria group bacterium]|nr:hypothetical protein [Patescibacteria group bacterium]